MIGGFVFYNRFEREFECDCYDLHGEPASQPALRQSRQYDWGISRPSPMLRKPKTSSISSNPNAFFPQQGHSAQGGSEFKSYGIITPTVKFIMFYIKILFAILHVKLLICANYVFFISACYTQIDVKLHMGFYLGPTA